MGLTVTPQKSSETQHIAASGAPDDDRPARSCFKQSNTAKNERPHDPLAEFCLAY